MTSNSKRLFTIAAALLCIALGAVQANAQYYTTYYSPYTSYYSPAYTSYYAPGYTSYYAPSTSYYAPAPAYTTGYGGGWYPGYYLNRIRTRLWGQPASYVAAYPATTYAAAYAPSTCASCQSNYAVSYAPACPSCSACSTCAPACSTCSTCTASYAPPSCPCESCGATETQSSYAQQSSYAPQQSYAQQQSYAPQQSSGCNCGVNGQSTYAAQYPAAAPPAAPATQQVIATPGTTVIQQNTVPSSTEQRPGLESNNTGAPPSTYKSNRPADAAQPQTQPQIQPPAQPQPQPATEDPYKIPSKTTDSSTYLESPKLFDPRDRTAQRRIAPVRTALYTQPASYHQISTSTSSSRAPITAKQAEQNAIGWSSASN